MPVEWDFGVSIDTRNADDTDHSPEMQPMQRDFGIEPVIVNSKAELPSVFPNLMGAVFAGLEKGNTPILSPEGTGGTYLLRDASGQERIAVFKPVDEEPLAANNPRGRPASSTGEGTRVGEGLKKGTRVGEGAFREVAAYILDHPSGGRRSFTGHGATGFAGVPPTALVRCLHTSFRQPEGNQPVFKLGSLQAFVKNCESCADLGTGTFPVQEVHKICVLDIRLANADRHDGNILFCKEEGCGMSLIPIDHGYCLPESFEDCTFCWLYWRQSKEPFDNETVEYIRLLDCEEDIAILTFHGLRVSAKCARILRVTTMLLKKGVERGLTAFDIGSTLCRETVTTKESRIEEIVREAEDGGNEEAAFVQSVSEIMDRYLDDVSREKGIAV